MGDDGGFADERRTSLLRASEPGSGVMLSDQLAIIGPILDGYGTWPLKRGYSAERVREHFRAAPRLVRSLQQCGVRALTSLTRVRLRACRPPDSREDPNLAVLVRQLARYCEFTVFRSLLGSRRPDERAVDPAVRAVVVPTDAPRRARLHAPPPPPGRSAPTASAARPRFSIVPSPRRPRSPPPSRSRGTA